MYDKKKIIFKGEEYKINSRGYYITKPKLLHREIWEEANGKIPDGFVIHHKDHDKENNKLGNFECLPKGKHDKHHLSIIHAKNTKDNV